jgi:hypothetical protein
MMIGEEAARSSHEASITGVSTAIFTRQEAAALRRRSHAREAALDDKDRAAILAVVQTKGCRPKSKTDFSFVCRMKSTSLPLNDAGCDRASRVL